MHAFGETVSLHVSFKIHLWGALHRRSSCSWFRVSLLMAVMTSKDCDYQQLVGALLIQLQRVLPLKDCLCFPPLISLFGGSHPTEARRPHFLFSVCVDTLFSELRTPHPGCGLIYSPTFEVKGNRWGSPRDKQEMGGHRRRAHLSQQSAPPARLEMVLTGGKISSCGVKLGSFWG